MSDRLRRGVEGVPYRRRPIRTDGKMGRNRANRIRSKGITTPLSSDALANYIPSERCTGSSHTTWPRTLSNLAEANISNPAKF